MSAEEFARRGKIEKKTLEFMQVGSTSREEVLLNLGEPDEVSKDERYFFYRLILLDGLFPERFDFGIQFDDKGVVKRYGEIWDWEPLDLSTSIEIPIKHRHASNDLEYYEDALLILGKDFFEFRELRDPSHNFRISPEELIQLTPRTQSNKFSYLPPSRLSIIFSNETRAGKHIWIEVDIFSCSTLYRYLIRNCPNLVIEPIILYPLLRALNLGIPF